MRRPPRPGRPPCPAVHGTLADPDYQRAIVLAADAGPGGPGPDPDTDAHHPSVRPAPALNRRPADLLLINTQREELTLAPDNNIGEMARWVQDLAAQRQAFCDKLEERQALKVPSEDPDFEDLGPAFPAWNPPGKDAILQPPKPEIQPSAKIIELARQPEPGREAAG